MAEKRLVAYDPITFESFKRHSTKFREPAGSTYDMGYMDAFDNVEDWLDFNTVDAVEMPKGKPGDFLEWDNGTGFKQIYCIHSVMICEDCMRYELANFTPVVNHPNIVRIMSREEAKKEWLERRARERTQEEPTLTACAEKMDGDGNG